MCAIDENFMSVYWLLRRKRTRGRLFLVAEVFFDVLHSVLMAEGVCRKMKLWWLVVLKRLECGESLIYER